MHTIIEDLNWRYAVKKFDPTQKVNDSDLEIIRESLRLSASSYGLQPLKYLFVENPELREKLVKASYNQRQVAEASHFLVICVIDELTEDHIDDYMQNTAKTNEINPQSLAGFRSMIINSTGKMQRHELRDWMSKQAYIALGQLLHTCASLRIDSTPMEGFNKEEYDEILQLKEKNLRSVLACPIGYRHTDDPYLKRKKVRKSLSDLFETII